MQYWKCLVSIANQVLNRTWLVMNFLSNHFFFKDGIIMKAATVQLIIIRFTWSNPTRQIILNITTSLLKNHGLKFVSWCSHSLSLILYFTIHSTVIQLTCMTQFIIRIWDKTNSHINWVTELNFTPEQQNKIFCSDIDILLILVLNMVSKC